MPLEDFIITVFCWVDQHLNTLLRDCRLRQRGFALKLTDRKVIMMEVVGEFLGWMRMSAAGSTSIAMSRRGFRNSDPAVRLPNRPPTCGWSSNGCISSS